ncbi:MAG: hypothetical protein P8Y94_02300 [Acidobacteriota bacterium]
MKHRVVILTLAMILPAVVLAQSERESAERRESERQEAHQVMGQKLVIEFVATHSGLAALEVLVTSENGCKMVAGSDPGEVGEKCGADELGTIRTGQPVVETPNGRDPLYEITQALHDSSGNLIGAAGMDLKPDIGSREAVLARAKTLLAELEAKIPSKAWLSQPAERD